jgi:four helix bundle protein
MTRINRFEDIEAWKTARKLANVIYALSGEGRFAKDFGLRDQIRRAAVSVMSNIAEGFDSRTDRLFRDYLGRARASAGEVRSQLYIAFDLEYISKGQFDDAYDLADKVSRQLYKFIAYLEAHPKDKRIREESSAYE